MFLLNSGVGKDWASPFFPPPLSSNLSIYLSVLGLNYSYTESEHSWLTYLKKKFKLQAFSQMILLNRGWGKTGPAHSSPLYYFLTFLFIGVSNCRVGKDWAGPFFPPSLIFGSFYWSFRLSFYVTLSLYLNINERHIPKWELSFLTYKIIGTSTLLGGKDWAGPFFPSSKTYWSIYLSFSLLNYAALSLHLNTNVWPVQKRKSCFEKQVYWYFCIVGWGKTGPAHSFPPPKFSYLFYLSFQSFGLCNSLNVSKQFWMTYSKVRIKFSIFKVYWFFYFVGWGKTGPAHSFPPAPLHNAWIFQFIV